MSKICGVFHIKRGSMSGDNAAEHAAGQLSDRTSGRELRIIVDACLTNRTELFEKFGVFSSEQKNITDAQLILEAYRRWGEECPARLAGDFAFAVWDKAKKKLFCARDHFGGSTLFYHFDGERFIFASEPAGILSREKVAKKFNRKKLAGYLLAEPHTLARDESWYEGILPVFPAMSLTVDERGVKSRRYWEPEPGKIAPDSPDKEILGAFRELFFEIIRARLENNPAPAALLSGGLDSSSIVSTAAKILEKQNREINVFAGVIDDDENGRFSDERGYIDRFKNFPNVRINYVTAPGAGPFSGLDEIFEHYHTPQLTSRHYLYRAFVRGARSIGARVLFDGCFGEMGATSHGRGGLAEMFAGFRWAGLWRELRLRKRLYGDSIRYNLRAHVINPLLPEFVVNLRRHGRLRGGIPYNPHHPLRADLARDLLAGVDLTLYLPSRTRPDHRRNQINDMILLQKIMTENFPLTYGREPVELRYPMLDKRLIEFTAAVPVGLKFRNGYSRYLIRAALDGVLPPEIQWRTSKTPFSPDYLRRYERQIDRVRELLAAIGPRDPLREILDIEKIRGWAELPVAVGDIYNANELIARDHLPQAVYLIYFLRQFPEFRP